MNLDPSTGNPVESKRIADANKRAEEAYMKKMESLLGQDLYRMEVFTAEEEEEMEAIRALKEAERKGREAYDRMAKPEDRIPKAEGGKFPDLTGDGKVTQADILKGRKVFQEGGTLMMPREKYGVGSKIASRIKKTVKKLTDSKSSEEEYLNTPNEDALYFSAEDIKKLRKEVPESDAYREMMDEFAAVRQQDDEIIKMSKALGYDRKKTKSILEGKKENITKLKNDFDDLAEKRLGEAENKAARDDFAEGSLMMPTEGMPVDTYDNIPPDEMDEALASQLPDNQMEDSYIDYILDESLDDSEQEYLADALQKDPRLEGILDKVMVTASEFSGAGEVEGPGTGVSDSIPARLSDGEFVFTRKATDQLGADNLQVMMDDAERAYDGGYQMKAEGGMMEDKDPMSQTQEEIEKLMMGANRMPSLR